MTRSLVVVRPEPGNSRTRHRIESSGYLAIALPLFNIIQIGWTPPDRRNFDALMLTSANAVRMAGGALDEYRTLPVIAVGAATAKAARAAGLRVVLTGNRDATALIEAARARGFRNPLHLAGRDRAGTHPSVVSVTVYASEPCDVTDAVIRDCADSVVLLHSARAAERLAVLVDAAAAQRRRIRIAALSPPVLSAAGDGWATSVYAAAPSDHMLVALATRLAD